MSAGCTGGANGAIMAAAVAQQINIRKMVGAVAYVESAVLEEVLRQAEPGVLVCSEQGWLGTHYRYLLSAYGLTWYCKADQPIAVPEGFPVIRAEKIEVPE